MEWYETARIFFTPKIKIKYIQKKAHIHEHFELFTVGSKSYLCMKMQRTGNILSREKNIVSVSVKNEEYCRKKIK